MKKTKILIVGPFPEPIHGMSLANMMLLENMSTIVEFEAQGFDTSLQKNLKEKSKQGRLTLSNIFGSVVNTFLCLVHILKTLPDVVYITPPQSAFGLLRLGPVIALSSIVSRKTILHIHGSRLDENINKTNWIVRKLISLMLKQADALIVLSDLIKEKFQENIPANIKLITCDNGVEIPSALPTKCGNKIKILFLSNLMKDKGILDLFDAAQGLPDNIELHLAGEIEPSLTGRVEAFLRERAGSVFYHGRVTGEKKNNLLVESSILILPSYDEGQPLAILEAYAFGCAVIATPVGGIPDIFTSSVNGEHCKPGEPSSIVEAIDKVLMKGISHYSLTNYRLAKQRFSKELFCSRIVSILKSGV